MFNDLHKICSVVPQRMSSKFKSDYLQQYLLGYECSPAFWHHLLGLVIVIKCVLCHTIVLQLVTDWKTGYLKIDNIWLVKF